VLRRFTPSGRGRECIDVAILATMGGTSSGNFRAGALFIAVLQRDVRAEMNEPFDRVFTKEEMDAIRRGMRDEESVLRNSWRKARSLGRQLPFAEDVIAAYFCVMDADTPRQVKLILLGALAYFVMPFDIIPDFLPLIGYTDDAAVLTAAFAAVASSITDEHRKKAREVVKAID
jgi:uncharacterized membrane protein YkvA (DUF1232 family)